MKTCGKCKRSKDYSCFYKKGDRPHYEGSSSGYSSDCKECILGRHKSDRVKDRRAELRKGGGARNSELKRTYGITLADYHDLLASQGGGCAVCHRKDSGHATQKNFHVDHDHETGRVRGLLCSRCNHAIGLSANNPDTLMSAAEYLKGSLPEFDASQERDVTYCQA